jgi:hypothetical protein
MSAIVIPFKPRPGDATAIAALVETTAEVLEFPSRPYSLNSGDVVALQALATMLDGIWIYETLVNDDGDTWAVFEDHNAPLLVFFVCRSGKRLRLFNSAGELVDSYANVDALTATLGDAIGRRATAQ